MPVLSKEPYLYPPDLLDETVDFESLGGSSWWALYTLPRNEKSLMRNLCAREQRFYCPVVARRNHHRGRGGVRTSYLPLFSNYVFLHGDEQDRYAAVCTGHVSRCLVIGDTDAFVQQMRAIQQLIDSGLAMDLVPGLEVGTRVRVKSGPLKGLQGSVVKSRNRARFLIHVDFLQQGASTVVDGWELERI
ncbi:MAG: transcription termination/antitermination NusG family protein [Planctomycetaceae bacterium]|nr:transcription termination/antitermination NusG family protein [Planctomycetaceae bacterium]